MAGMYRYKSGPQPVGRVNDAHRRIFCGVAFLGRFPVKSMIMLSGRGRLRMGEFFGEDAPLGDGTDLPDWGPECLYFGG